MEDATLQAIKELAEALRSDMQTAIAALDKKCDGIADSFSALKKKADEAGERDRGVDGTMAERVAADSVDPAAFAALSSSVAELKKRQSRPMKDLNAYADVQAKADSVMRALGSAAEPPMAGEDLVPYKIRMHRKMQPYSPRWKGVELQLIAADQVALDNVLGEIRTDAMTAAMSPVGMPEFQHRKITKTMPGGHTVHEFIGNGTIFKQLSRPVRHVAYIGTRN
ncbi:hypothetical protein JQ595_37355 [Bradyrhizobium japonicum]|uniref:hypothetical protein n=1 Tax=Bradyrhizobium japonicum TaxID=375 RepID=UPI001BA9366E|nr:hypothetical protein [Bradyrhizobium japonicum]MBR0734430.1 hypothetical protein [Bradyrhizobium japonicum]